MREETIGMWRQWMRERCIGNDSSSREGADELCDLALAGLRSQPSAVAEAMDTNEIRLFACRLTGHIQWLKEAYPHAKVVPAELQKIADFLAKLQTINAAARLAVGESGSASTADHGLNAPETTPAAPTQPWDGIDRRRAADDRPNSTLCNEYAGHLIAGASWFCCMLPKGHAPSEHPDSVNGHLRGGTCFKHGNYAGRQCPKWPDCVPNSTAHLTKERVSELWQQSLKDIATGFFDHSFVPGSGRPTVQQRFYELLRAALIPNSTPQAGQVLRLALEQIKREDSMPYGLGKFAAIANDALTRAREIENAP